MVQHGCLRKSSQTSRNAGAFALNERATDGTTMSTTEARPLVAQNKTALQSEVRGRGASRRKSQCKTEEPRNMCRLQLAGYSRCLVCPMLGVRSFSEAG